MKKNAYGFTIVELLIVIVVIGILAAISIVAYNGVSNKANDSAVRSDVANLTKKVQLLEAELGSIPPSGQRVGGSGAAFPGITFKPAKSSYDTTVDNLFYCEGLRSGRPAYILTARSKSGRSINYKSTEGFSEQAGGHPSDICLNYLDAGTRYYTFGFDIASNSWFGWTNS